MGEKKIKQQIDERKLYLLMGNISHLPVPPVIKIRHYKYNEKGVYGL